MDYENTGRQILDLIGGPSNIEHIEHCSTRLRLSLHDNKLVDSSKLEKVPGVIGVRVNAQCQIVIGKEVADVCNALKRLVAGKQTTRDKARAKKKWGAVIVDFVISVFQPLIPAIAGGGVLKSLLIILDMVGWLSKETSTYKVLDSIGTAPIYFLPLLVAITTATKLKVNILLAVSAVSVLILPSLTAMMAKGTTFLIFDIKNIPYATQVFPAIICVLFYAQTEKFFNRYSPSALKIFLAPMMSLLVTVPVTLLFLGPLGYELGSALATVILWLYGKFGFVATAVLAGALPFIVAAGMHKPLLPYAVAAMGQFGRETLYLPASLAHNIAEAGACLAITIKSKDKSMKSTALSSGLSALCGITEPALYGITLLNKKVLYSVMIGSVIGGGFLSYMAVAAFALVGPGLASISIFAAPDNPHNLIYAFSGAIISFVLTFAVTLLLWQDKAKVDSKETSTNKPATEALKIAVLTSPIQGKVIPLEEVNDDVFSSKIMGDGIAVIPTFGALYAPANGVICHVFESGHAASMLMENGAEIIFHIGIDTIQMNGKGFNPKISDNQTVKKGDLLIEFDISQIVKAGYDPVVVMVVTNSERFEITAESPKNEIDNQFNILTLKEAI
ncbi:beta-glucoside-specific PTS transporter subunit IIABC [Pantoea sp. App145]|uniref:beta-glucoside-specific PTS transporter subunit IIABC n=1 Tax=Pantoea sp. App145 TaxID=3071567 RepID=UPI003A80282D